MPNKPGGKRKINLNTPHPSGAAASPQPRLPAEPQQSGTQKSSRNLNAHPGLPDQPKPRRSPQEVADERKKTEEAARQKEESKAKALQKVANLEDRYRREDVSGERDLHAVHSLHPAPPGLRKAVGERPVKEPVGELSFHTNINPTPLTNL
jgi:hypothetical protein